MLTDLIETRRHVRLAEISHLQPTMGGEYLVSERRGDFGPIVCTTIGPEDGEMFARLARHLFQEWAK